MTTSETHIAELSHERVQGFIDDHAADGWHLGSTDATSSGLSVRLRLERDQEGA